MNLAALPWFEATVLLPLVGALVTALLRAPALAARSCLVFLGAILVCGAGAAVAPREVGGRGVWGLAVDDLSAPMLPVLAFLHLITMLGTAKSRVSTDFCVRLLLAAFLSLATVTCQVPALLVLLLCLGVLLPWWDLRSRACRGRSYLVFMGLFVVFLVAGVGLISRGWSTLGSGLVLFALLLRGGIVPGHSWLPALFRHAAFGTAMVFVLPLFEVLAALRLLFPLAPTEWLNVGAALCLLTAVYGAGMALVQTEVRKFYGQLCLSQTSLVLFAVMLHTANGLTAALCLWISATVSLAGLAFAIRALEARFGALSLNESHGYYEQVPALAVCFLITGLASVGFPGTIGFVPMELLISGSADEGLWICATLAVASMLNGIAILRAYFALFTGKRPTTSVSLQITQAERIGVTLVTVAVFLGGWFSPGVVASRHRIADQILERGATDHEVQLPADSNGVAR